MARKVNQLDADRLSPLHYAARYNSPEVINLLIDSGAGTLIFILVLNVFITKFFLQICS